MLNNPSLLKDILSLLYKYANIFVMGFEKKCIQLSLIIDLANDSIRSSKCRNNTICQVKVFRDNVHCLFSVDTEIDLCISSYKFLYENSEIMLSYLKQYSN